MNPDILYIDFSIQQNHFPQVHETWQQEIIDFIYTYLHQDHILVQTSGSTGKPKTYQLPKKAMQQSAAMTAKFLNLKKGDTALLCMPVSYIAGKMMVVRAIELGMKLICVEPKSHIQYHGHIDFAALTPMQAEASLQNLTTNLKIKKLILGGAKVSSFLEKQLESLETEVYETYGMTETITHIAMRQIHKQQHFHTLENIDIRQNSQGCLVIQTPYFTEPIETNDVVDIINPTEFKILGRSDYIINSGGLKINPEALEEILKPYIKQPFIIHYKQDTTLGQKVVLLIESPEPITISFPQDIIPKNKQPKEIIFISHFPRTSSGKIQRKKIQL